MYGLGERMYQISGLYRLSFGQGSGTNQQILTPITKRVNIGTPPQSLRASNVFHIGHRGIRLKLDI